ncbi:MAG: IPT/TIG domain-containing protein [Candidatus Acidiferrales bacterium]
MKRPWRAALTSVAGLLVLLGGCGGGAPALNSTPAITDLFPSNITAGSDDFTLSIAGTGFISNSTGVTFAYWNGSPRSTTLNAVTGQLQVSISAADVANPGVPQITLFSPGPGGGTSSAATFTIEPVQGAAPTITSLDPTSAKAGGMAFTLTLDGTNFAANDVMTWNGSVLAPTNISGNQATATVPADDIANVGTGSVAVSTSGLVIASPSVAFPITGPNNPSPTASSLSPSKTVAGGADFEVFVGGSNFVSSSVVEWNSSPRATAFVSSSRLVVLITAADIAVASTAQITVTNPAPGGGTSSQVAFTVSAP